MQFVGLVQLVQFGEQTGMQELLEVVTVAFSIYPNWHVKHLVGELQFAQFIEQFGKQPPVEFKKYWGWHCVQLVGLVQFVQFGEHCGMHPNDVLFQRGKHWVQFVGEEQFWQPIGQIGKHPPVWFKEYPIVQFVQFEGVVQFTQFGEHWGAQVELVVKFHLGWQVMQVPGEEQLMQPGAQSG